ncbi:MAG: sn-glycerol-3-phosphate ABC transporter permease UgpE [Proteobacteria bacterium]|nr:sn-glycerol-3-phosphate ABC transporter permease UgpE [Pseudomonadota bacterium]
MSPPAFPRLSQFNQEGLFTYASHFCLLLGIIVVAFPVWVILVASTHPPEALATSPIPLWFGSHGFANYHTLLTVGITDIGGAPLWLMLGNSLIMALGITIGKISVSLLAAFALVYFRFPGRWLFFWLILMTLMLPVEVRILPTFEVIARLDLLNSYIGLTLPLIASATATFLFRQFFMTVPTELVEAARMDGAGAMGFFKDILLPLSRTNIAALSIILFIYGWNQYLWPLIITTDEGYTTIVMGIQRMVNSGEALPLWHLIMGMAVLAMLPPVLVVLAMQRLFVRGLIEVEK